MFEGSYVLVLCYNDCVHPPKTIMIGDENSVYHELSIRKSQLERAISQVKKCDNCILHSVYAMGIPGWLPDFNNIIKQTKGMECFHPHKTQLDKDVQISMDNDVVMMANSLYECTNRISEIKIDDMVLPITATYSMWKKED